MRRSIHSQPPVIRVNASRSARPPAEIPVWASSPTRSTTDAASSPPLGGCTGRPISIASSDSKPWRGTGGSAGLDGLSRGLVVRGDVWAGRLGVARGLVVCAVGERAGRLGVVSARVAAVCRAAALRALGRWGRVLGRLDSTPASSAGPAGGEVVSARRRPPDRLSLLGGLMEWAQSSRICVRHTGWGRVGVNMGHVRL